MPRAPEVMGFSMKRLPSVVPPRVATKTAPERTRRESYSIPVIGASDAPAEPSEAISAMRSFHFMLCSIVEVLSRAMHDNARPGRDHGSRCGRLFADGTAADHLYFQARVGYGDDDLAHGKAYQRRHFECIRRWDDD